MKTSIGIDIVDVDDFSKRLARTKNLKGRIFTEYETSYCKKKGVEHLASRFAAKEAFAKASNLKQLQWKDVEVRNTKEGKPYFKLSNGIKNKFKIKSTDLSISNIKNTAVAVVIISI